MSAENNDMSRTDISFLLADAADEVEIGIAPVQAVIRGGRRRRARRWAVAAATALVLAGSTGATLAVTGLPGGGHTGTRSDVATAPPAPQDPRHVYTPQLTELARGTDHGKRWRVVLSVWGPPRDHTEVTGQLAAMRKYGIDEGALPDRLHLIGKTSHYAGLYYGGNHLRVIMFDSAVKWASMTATDSMSAALPLAEGNSDGPERLVVGEVSTTAPQVKCVWKDGTSTLTRPVRAAGSPVNWFVCTAPEGTSYANAEVFE
ncbi:hypothetical protein [Streptomyces sp. NPDC127190]|uniref:hypothetical protein n=1 Tax=unclassified Streptomyces TaxID=2593676 RepID=UPI00362CEF77